MYTVSKSADEDPMRAGDYDLSADISSGLFYFGRTGMNVIRRGVFVAVLASLLAVGQAGAAESSPEAEDAAISANLPVERLGQLQTSYVPGEVIVKLADGPAGGIRAFSQDAVLATHAATLLRFQAEYGVA